MVAVLCIGSGWPSLLMRGGVEMIVGGESTSRPSLIVKVGVVVSSL